MRCPKYLETSASASGQLVAYHLLQKNITNELMGLINVKKDVISYNPRNVTHMAQQVAGILHMFFMDLEAPN